MNPKPTAWSFTLAFREHWFAAMSGGASVPFTVLAVFVDAKWAQLIFAGCALICAWFAAYRVWKPERQKVCDLEERLRPKLRVRFDKAVPDCMPIVTFMHPDGVQTKGRCFRLQVMSDSDSKLYDCMGWLAELRNLKTQQVVQSVRLLWAGVPTAAAAVDLVKGVPRYVEMCVATDADQITVTTEGGGVWPIDAMHIFDKPGEYLFRIVIEARDTVATSITRKLNWTGNWTTTDMV
jgi:hypothetical protein